MAIIPEPTITTASLIDAFHERHQEPPRAHLGASLLGHHCERYLWLSFRWVRPERFSGRILRLFRRGHNEEATIIRDLRNVGIDVKTTDGSQDRVDFGNHVSGSMDGMAYSGVHEAPKTPHVLEFKTHSKKSFDDLEKNGLEKSKPQHFAQCNVYMLGANIDRALYVAVCKDDDRYYTERVKLDKEFAQKLVDKGHRIVAEPSLPPPISTDPTWYQCKICSYHEFCHKQALPVSSCRTCAHSTPMPDSTWRCERHQADNIPLEFQRKGCNDHAIHPDLVPWKLDENASTEHEPVFIIDDVAIKNGTSGYLSTELLSNPQACVSGELDYIREKLGARIVG